MTITHVGTGDRASDYGDGRFGDGFQNYTWKNWAVRAIIFIGQQMESEICEFPQSSGATYELFVSNAGTFLTADVIDLRFAFERPL